MLFIVIIEVCGYWRIFLLWCAVSFVDNWLLKWFVRFLWIFSCSWNDLDFKQCLVVCVLQPELLYPDSNSQGYGITSDVWSFGITMVVTKSLLTTFTSYRCITPRLRLTCVTNPLPPWAYCAVWTAVMDSRTFSGFFMLSAFLVVFHQFSVLLTCDRQVSYPSVF